MGSPYHSSFRERLHGFYLGLKLYKMRSRAEWVITGEETGHAAFKKIHECQQRPTAIVACNDFFALDVMDFCSKEGINIPDDYSIIGFDDIESSAWSQPALTTVRVLTDEMGEKAACRLIEKINDPESTPTTSLIGTELVIRESCSKL
jgi:DNA-binding LacI/PurR family transcriptional regulator